MPIKKCDGCRNAATHAVKLTSARRKKGNWCDACDPPTPKRSAPQQRGTALRGALSPPSRTKTRTIAGHRISLTEGIRYVATRPGAFDPSRLDRKRKHFDVTISVYSTSNTAHVIPSLSYDDANRFINTFNNGAMSFDGRVW